MWLFIRFFPEIFRFFCLYCYKNGFVREVMKTNEKFMALVLVLFLVVLYHYQSVRVFTEVKEQRVVVREVLDGDTIKVWLYGKEQRVRLLGIDAPEVSSRDCLSAEATRVLQQLVGGKTVMLEPEKGVNKDKYGRYMRYVSVRGKDVSEVLLLNGYAKVFLEGSLKRKRAYEKAEAVARENRRGVWGACVS